MQGFIKKQSIEKLVSEVSLTQVVASRLELRKGAGHFTAKCPFHADSTPSFTVYATHYHCFGCGAHGDAIGFEMRFSGRSYVEVVEDLASRFGVFLEREPLARGIDQKLARKIQDLNYFMEETSQFYHEKLMQRDATQAREYLKSRGFDKSLAQAWRVGYAGPENGLLNHARQNKWDLNYLVELGLIKQGRNGYHDFFRSRLLFPICNDKGKVVAFGGRAIPGVSDLNAPKYLNSTESPLFSKSRTLFNFHNASAAARQRDRIILVEGYMDCITLVNHGLLECVAILGTALTNEHVKLIRRCTTKVYSCFDNDEAGRKATLRSFQNIFPLDWVDMQTVVLEGAKDPDSCVNQLGMDSFQQCIQKSVSTTHFVVKNMIQNESHSERKLRLIQDEILPVIRSNPNPSSVNIAESICAKILGLPVEVLSRTKSQTLQRSFGPVQNPLESEENQQKNALEPCQIMVSTKEECRLLFLLSQSRYSETPLLLRAWASPETHEGIEPIDMKIWEQTLNAKSEDFRQVLKQLLGLIKDTSLESALQVDLEKVSDRLSPSTLGFLGVLKGDAEILFKFDLDKWIGNLNLPSGVQMAPLLNDPNLLDIKNQQLFRSLKKDAIMCAQHKVLNQEIQRLMYSLEERFLFEFSGKMLADPDLKFQYLAFEEQRRFRLERLRTPQAKILES